MVVKYNSKVFSKLIFVELTDGNLMAVGWP